MNSLIAFAFIADLKWIILLQLGVAIGFLLPPVLVDGSGTEDTIKRQLQTMFIGVASLTTVLLILIVICKCKKITEHNT